MMMGDESGTDGILGDGEPTDTGKKKVSRSSSGDTRRTASGDTRRTSSGDTR